MRLILAVLTAVLPTGCFLDYSVGDLKEVEYTKSVREKIASPVEVEFRVQVEGKSNVSWWPWAGAVSRSIRANFKRSRSEAFEYLTSLGAFGAPEYKLNYDSSSPMFFGYSGAAEEKLRVRLTLLMDPGRWTAAIWIRLLSLTAIPTWGTVRSDLIAEVWDSSGNLLLLERYKERHRRIVWLPLLVTWPYQNVFPAYQGRIRKQLDHFLIDLRQALGSEVGGAWEG